MNASDHLGLNLAIIKQSGVKSVFAPISETQGDFNKSLVMSPSLEMDKFLLCLDTGINNDLDFRLAYKLLDLDPGLEYTPEQSLNVFIMAEMVKVGFWIDRDISKQLWNVTIDRVIDCRHLSCSRIKSRILSFLNELPENTFIILGWPLYDDISSKIIYDTGIPDDALYLISQDAIKYKFYKWAESPDYYLTDNGQFLWRFIVDKWDIIFTCETKTRMEIMNHENIIKFVGLPIESTTQR